MLKTVAKGPKAFNISFRFFVSSLLIAPINGAVTKYVVRNIVAPMIRVIQFDMFNKNNTMVVNAAAINDDSTILIDDL